MMAGVGDPRARVLVLARAFPNRALPGQGLWVERLVQASRAFATPCVVSPIAWVPPGAPVPEWRQLRDVPRQTERDGVRVWHPRVPGGLLHSTSSWDARLALPVLRRFVERQHRDAPYSLIHAHFIYPEGVIAAALGREFSIPVVTTEHANWRPWLDQAPSVRRQVLAALPNIKIVTAVSEATRRSIAEVAGDRVPIDCLPNVLDESAFGPPGTESRVPGRILFVGMIRHVKGLDQLVMALSILQRRGSAARLRVVGSTLSASNRRDHLAVLRQIEALGLGESVQFAGLLTPPEVAAEMRRASVLAVPSRRESFSAVTIEALASGLPVVATRCGGPEELIDETVGRLVPVDDPDAMAQALSEVLDAPQRFDSRELRQRVLPRFGMAAIAAQLRGVYRRAGVAFPVD